ncbi:MAG: stage III sporulation protein AC [Oscillospiraceae bacterium]|nr:stage III sporulation protein AC [Ruminococcus sp.]MBP1565010.1 stage III sporulation protein AC [Oscillospiraceae bacterium]MBQ9982629.1 stage III sporulation protein AC [Oscillospiraceae bacterium]
MDIDLIFKIAGTGIIVAVLNLVLKRAEREEQAMLTTLAGLIVVLMLIIDEIGTLFETVKSVFGIW